MIELHLVIRISRDDVRRFCIAVVQLLLLILAHSVF